MTKLIDLTGRKFGRLLAIKRINKKWLCTCECGTSKLILSSNLLRGLTKSCGCLRVETCADNGKKTATHGFSNTLLYKTWQTIKERCGNQNSKDYERYGGRGIAIAECWKNDFPAFRDWILANIGPRPNGLSLDRIKNDLGYQPGNLRWATASQQQLNRRDNIKLRGTEKNVVEVARENGINVDTLKYRIDAGWDATSAINTEPSHRRALVGKTVNKLLILEPTDKTYRGEIVWKCKCQCGNICDVRTTYLTSGTKFSCGCTRRPYGEVRV